MQSNQVFIDIARLESTSSTQPLRVVINAIILLTLFHSFSLSVFSSLGYLVVVFIGVVVSGPCPRPRPRRVGIEILTTTNIIHSYRLLLYLLVQVVKLVYTVLLSWFRDLLLLRVRLDSSRSSPPAPEGW